MLFFALSVSDSHFHNFNIFLIYEIVPWKFWLGYAAIVYIIFKTAMFFSLTANKYYLTDRDSKLVIVKKTSVVILLSVYFGFLINLSNVFIIVLFERFVR